MFDLIFVNNLQPIPSDIPWPIESTNYNHRTHLLRQAKYFLGMNRVDQYSLIKASCKKWLKNEIDLNDNEYELLI